jgi:hypothetical protein
MSNEMENVMRVVHLFVSRHDAPKAAASIQDAITGRLRLTSLWVRASAVYRHLLRQYLMLSEPLIHYRLDFERHPTPCCSAQQWAGLIHFNQVLIGHRRYVAGVLDDSFDYERLRDCTIVAFLHYSPYQPQVGFF